MLFKWKRTAQDLQQQSDTLQRTCADQAARITALEEQLAAARAESAAGQRQLDYYRGVAGNLVRFSASVAHWATPSNTSRAGSVITATARSRSPTRR